MQKIIHYCWFGPNKKPKLFYKCLKSWKKYLPDFEIKEWNENNFNFKDNKFAKQAYDAKKWAFVADYVRTKVLYEEGGLYLDTDMELVAPIDDLLVKDETFLGFEQSSFVAVGIWWEKNKKSYLATELLKKYDDLEFSVDSMIINTIPKLITNILMPYGLDVLDYFNNQTVKNIKIYEPSYFYPLTFERDINIKNNNTRAIHYYDSSWVNVNYRKINLIKYRENKYTKNIYSFIRFIFRIIKKYLKRLLSLKSKIIDEMRFKFSSHISDNVIKTVDDIKKLDNNSNYIAFYNGEWLGTTNSTKGLFKYIIDSREINNLKEVKMITVAILEKTNVKQVIFSAFPKGAARLIKYLHKENKDIKVKIFWHASNSQMFDIYALERNMEIIDLYKKAYVESVALCKKSLVDFYNKKGIKTFFLNNIVKGNFKENIKNNKDDNKIKIGLYASNPRAKGKNLFSQMVAVSLIENAILDVVPLSDEVMEIANILNIKVTGVKKSLLRDDLMDRMKQNDINIYVTYTECAPMLPLESLENGVPCITGNNHHYFEGKLKDLLVVDNENNVDEIKNKIILAKNNRKKIIELYKKEKDFVKKETEKLVEEFLKSGNE